MKTDLIEIFQTIRASIQPYAAMGFEDRISSETMYDLWSNKNVEVDGKKRNEVFFASVKIEKNDVRLILLPDYRQGDLEKTADPNLLKLLKPKTGFHITQLDEFLLSQIENSLAACYKYFKEEDWV